MKQEGRMSDYAPPSNLAASSLAQGRAHGTPGHGAGHQAEHETGHGLDSFLVGATVFLAPMNYFRLEAFYVTAADVTALLALLVMLATRRVSLNIFGPATMIWFLSFAAFVGGFTLGSLFRGDPTALAPVFVQYSYSLLILPLVLATRPFAQILTLLRLLVLSLVVVMLVGIWLMYMVEDAHYLLVSPRGRMRSLIERENECAMLGGIAIVLLMGLYRLGSLRLWAVLAATPVLLFGIALTGSISGVILTLLGIGAYVVLSRPLHRTLLILAAAVPVVAAAILWGDMFLPEIFRDRVLAPFLSGDLSAAGNFTDRQLLLREGMDIARDTLFLGLGADQYRSVSAHGVPVHNVYILTIAEGGILSLVGIVGLFTAGFYLIWLLIRDQRRSASTSISAQVWPITLTVLLLYAIAFNMFPSFFARFWNVPFVLALALARAAHDLNQMALRHRIHQRPPVRPAPRHRKAATDPANSDRANRRPHS